MLGLPIENISIKLGDSSLPQSPVEGGSWIAASVSHAIIATAEESPQGTAGRGKEDEKFAARQCQAGRCHALERKIVEQERPHHRGNRSLTQCATVRWIASKKEKLHIFKEKVGYAHNTHSAVFAEVKVDEELGSSA